MALGKYETDFLKFLVENDEEAYKMVKEYAELNSVKSDIFEERIITANKYVDEGNAQFKSGQYTAAQRDYIQAAYHADFDYGQIFEMTEPHRKQVRDTKIRILLNVTNNLLNLEQPHLARQAATLGIKLSEANGDTQSQAVGKFYYRRGRANLEVHHHKEAVMDLREALNRVPKDDTITKALHHAIKAEKQDKDDMDKLWKNKGEKLFGDIPTVELVLTDEDGNPIESTKNNSGVVPSTLPSIWQNLMALLCCKKRKRD
jgi:tetratricopeptide (TPR) repeat protein